MPNFTFVIEREPGVFEEAPRGLSFTTGAVLHPWDVAMLWTDGELASIDCYRVPEIIVPSGKRLVSHTIQRVDGVVTDVGVFEDIPVPPPQPITVAASSAKLVLDERVVTQDPRATLYDQVEAMCLAHPVKAVRIFWSSANTWVEDNAYVLAIGAEFNLTAEQMHEMFVQARLKDAMP